MIINNMQSTWALRSRIRYIYVFFTQCLVLCVWWNLKRYRWWHVSCSISRVKPPSEHEHIPTSNEMQFTMQPAPATIERKEKKIGFKTNHDHRDRPPGSYSEKTIYFYLYTKEFFFVLFYCCCCMCIVASTLCSRRIHNINKIEFVINSIVCVLV